MYNVVSFRDDNDVDDDDDDDLGERPEEQRTSSSPTGRRTSRIIRLPRFDLGGPKSPGREQTHASFGAHLRIFRGDVAAWKKMLSRLLVRPILLCEKRIPLFVIDPSLTKSLIRLTTEKWFTG